jgi:hypothetical protein
MIYTKRTGQLTDNRMAMKALGIKTCHYQGGIQWLEIWSKWPNKGCAHFVARE